METILDRLEIKAGDKIFLHVSFSRLRHLAATPRELITRLIERLGPTGTLALPRYTWNVEPNARPWEGYRKFLDRRPLLDLRTMPTNMGAVPEYFRQLPGVKVSTSYLWPVSLLGANADSLTTGQAHLQNPFGQSSTLYRLLAENFKVVGLGVTLNTTSIAPVSDFLIYGDASPAFTDGLIAGTIIDLDGVRVETRATTLTPEYVRDVKPSIVLTTRLESGSDFPYFEDEQGTIFFCYPSQLYHDNAMLLAETFPTEYVWLPGYPHPRPIPSMKTRNVPFGVKAR